MSNTYENHMDNLPITSWEIMGHPILIYDPETNIYPLVNVSIFHFLWW